MREYEHTVNDRPNLAPIDKYDQGSLDRRLKTSENFQPEKPLAGSSLNLPEVQGFEQTGLTNSAEIKRYLGETFPPEHVDHASLPSVVYHDVYKPAQDGNFLGMTRYNQETGVSHIEIYRQQQEGNSNPADMTYTLAHEVGHNAYWVSGESVQRSWDKLSVASASDEYVTGYARTGVREDFAESYATYVLDPDLLSEVSQKKYDFMRNFIFSGREYR